MPTSTHSIKAKCCSTINRIIDALSFNYEVRNLVDVLNKKIEHPEKVIIHLPTHPGGFSRELYKRRISIAEAYIKIVQALESEKNDERLHALQSLVEYSLHAKTINMPLNTARVQIALMKEAVKNKEDRRKQLELLTDFALASYGQEAVIVKLLKELNLMEVPEKSMKLAELDMGWDNHVHDNLSEGRKTPSQVLLDAFVKGISRLTLAYYDIADEGIITEAMDAGEILGINVNIGIEFSVGEKGTRRHFMYIPPEARTPEEFYNFFKKNHDKLSRFLTGLKENAEKRKSTINSMLEMFNETHLKKINAGYSKGSPLYLEPLKWEDLQKIVLQGQASRMHLGELLYTKLKNVLHKRVLSLKAQYLTMLHSSKTKQTSPWELQTIENQYRLIRKQYENLSPINLRTEYLEDRDIVDYNSAFRSEDDILPELVSCGGDIVYIHPLEAGFKTSVNTLIEFSVYITRVETLNMYDSAKRNPNELRLLNTFVDMLNNHSIEDINKFLEEWDLSGEIEEKILHRACEHYRKNPLVPVCGSDSTGRDPKIPGMGFIKLSSMPKAIRKYYAKLHTKLPLPIATLIITAGKTLPSEKNNSSYEIVSMGKSAEIKKKLVGDEETSSLVSLSNFWRYLNPAIKSILRIGVSFPFAYYTIGLNYALIWYGITLTRNVLVDLVSTSGVDPKEWSWKDINFDNATQSLFWTGFSVPILAAVKNGFDIVWANLHMGKDFLMEWVKFFFICFANGTYIATHNRLRNFDSKVIRVNFFRSILSWPFAATFSFMGEFLRIPDIVQAKFWADIVAGIIEGTGKFFQRLVLRKRDLIELLPQLNSPDREKRTTAMLDILYIWAKRHRGDTCLSQILLKSKTSSFKKILMKTKPGSENENKENEKIFFSYFQSLYELFNEEGAMLTLTNFVLEHYSGKEAVIMTDILADYFVKFTNWLQSINDKLTSTSSQN